MRSYKVFITKSSEAANRIARSFSCNLDEATDILKVEHGEVSETTAFVPAIYHGRGYYYCMAELSDRSESGKYYSPEYDLVIC